MRYRDSASSLADWPHTWWAERLEVGVTREMTEALRARLPGWTVCEASCVDGAAGDVVLRIDFQALDFVRGTATPARLQALALADAGSGDATLWRTEQRVVIDEIRYTSHPDLPAQRSVKFNYVDRQDTDEFAWASGIKSPVGAGAVGPAHPADAR